MHEETKQSKKQENNYQELLQAQSNKILALEEQVQTLLLENSTLENELLMKSEKLEKMNESDLIVKENEKLKLLNQNLKQDKVKAEVEKDRAISQARTKIKEVEREAYRLEKKEEVINETIKSRADELKANAEEQLKQKYKAMTVKYGAFFSVIATYSIIVTFFALGYNETAFKSDFTSFLAKIGDLISSIFKMPLNSGNFTSN